MTPHAAAQATTPSLAVDPRPKDAKADHLRKEGTVPAILYGHKVGNRPVQCNAKSLRKILREAGESTVVELVLEGKTIPVLIHAVDSDPVTDHTRHVDFYALDMSKRVKTHVPIVTTGVSLAVKDLAGVLVHTKQTIGISCLPKDLPHAFTVDIGALEKFHDTITVAQLTPLPGVTILDPASEIVLTVVPPREEEVAEVKPVALGAVPAEGAEAPVPPTGTTPTAEGQPAPAEEVKKSKEKGKEKKR